MPPALPPPGSSRLARSLILCALILLLAHLLDPWAYNALTWANHERLERRDWYRLARVMGYIPTWLNVAACLMLVHLAHRRTHPPQRLPTGLFPPRPALGGAVSLVASAAIAGTLAELLKPIVGRERPTGFGYTFKPFLQGFTDNDNLSFPSSHAAVAFGAAFALARLFPPTAPVVIGLAVLCGVSRIQAEAHHLSDVVAAAIIAWFTARWVVSLEGSR